MIKTDYLGWRLIMVIEDDGEWLAVYENESRKHISGAGKNPEAAVATAQKKVKNVQ